MSFLEKLFGPKKNKQEVPTPQVAIQRLRETEEILLKKQDFLETKVEQELKIAKTNGSKNKRVALQALKRKKHYEKQLQQIDGTLTTIEYQREALESASSNTEVLKVLGYAAKALKNAHSMDVDDVHELIDEVQDQQEIANEIAEALTNKQGYQQYDEDELMKELEEMEQEDLNEKMLQVSKDDSIKLPSVPTAEPSMPSKSKAHKEVDNDLDELAQWAS